jgi:hypothetical protein
LNYSFRFLIWQDINIYKKNFKRRIFLSISLKCGIKLISIRNSFDEATIIFVNNMETVITITFLDGIMKMQIFFIFDNEYKLHKLQFDKNCMIRNIYIECAPGMWLVNFKSSAEEFRQGISPSAATEQKSFLI